ncbi:MAG: class I SAM-dependent methyltransferase [Arenimonas sp.]
MRAERPPTPVRHPHVVKDLASRQWKAEKIAHLLGIDARPGPLRLLEIGTGSGGIASWFGRHPSGRFEVHAVDVVDNRMVEEGYRFQLVQDTKLPYEDTCFDLVLSNHVIEHVGDPAAQALHLGEVGRVLRREGTGYLAVPNRWMLVEPHYHLAFLSWLPRSWRSPYLRAAGRGDFYDCEPLRLPELERCLAAAGFGFRNRGVEALRATFEIERAQAPATRWLRRVPDALLQPFQRLIPTHIYTFEHGR